jgi:hypothetical protein
MLDIMAERVANNWAALTLNPEIREAKERDWGAFFQQVIDFISMLLPLFADFCPTDPARVKARAAAWVAAMEGGRKELRALGWIGRIQLRSCQRRINRELGPEISQEIDNEEFQLAMFKTVAESTEGEVVSLRATAEKLRAEAA